VGSDSSVTLDFTGFGALRLVSLPCCCPGSPSRLSLFGIPAAAQASQERESKGKSEDFLERGLVARDMVRATGDETRYV
jgi:hypothetical protein